MLVGHGGSRVPMRVASTFYPFPCRSQSTGTYRVTRDVAPRSPSRLRVECIDRIQLPNLVDEALVEVRAEGLVRFIGVTGPGARVAAMHRLNLERFPFDAPVLPDDFPMMAFPEYAPDFEALVAVRASVASPCQ